MGVISAPKTHGFGMDLSLAPQSLKTACGEFTWLFTPEIARGCSLGFLPQRLHKAFPQLSNLDLTIC